MNLTSLRIRSPGASMIQALYLAAAVFLCDALRASAAQNSAGFVSETATEFTTSGDWDGNGLRDLMVLDKATGLVRLGYQLTPMRLTWSEPEATGIQDVTGCSAGVFIDATRVSLVFTAPEANRVQLMRSAGVGQSSTVTSIFPVGVGPAGVLGLPSKSDVARQDLLVASTWNGAPANKLEVLSNRTNQFQPRFSLPSIDGIQQANLVSLEASGPQYAAFLSKGPAPLNLRVCQADGFLVEVSTITNLTAGSRYLYGQFDQTEFKHVLFYEQGQAIFFARQAGRTGTRLTFSPAARFQLPRSLAQLHSIPGTAPTPDRLLAVFTENGARNAAVYSFDGRNTPELIQELQSQDGSPFTGAAALPGGHIVLLQGTADGASTRFQLFESSGNGYTLAQSGSLPEVKNRAPAANVLFFANSPFVQRGAPLIGAQRVGDWTSQLQFTNTPASVGLRSESRGDEAQGLFGPISSSILPAPLGTGAALPNQLAPAMSLFSYLAASGDAVDDLKISPAPGTYSETLAVTIAAQHSDSTAKYRLSPGAGWSSYTAPLLVGTSSTIQYYAQRPDGRRTRTFSASYQFTSGPEALDSDGDGVPDFVEISKGLDPVESGWDADADGASDLSELLHGSNLTNSLSKPMEATDLQASYDLVATPRPWDPWAHTNTFALPHGSVQAFGMDGSLLGKAQLTASTLSPNAGTALLTNLPVARERQIIALATEPHMDIAVARTERRVGREMIALSARPRIDPPQIGYVPGGGDLASESAAWIAALRNSADFEIRHLVRTDLSVESTVTALLFQAKLGRILHSRGRVPRPDAALFPSRPQDAGRTAISPENILDVETQFSVSPNQVHPGFKLRGMLETLNAHVRSTNSAALLTTAQILYGLSAAKNNAAQQGMAAPLDALRQFIETGSLPAPYMGDSALPPGLLQWASNDVASALQSISPRPVEQMILRVGDTTGACATLWNSTNTPVNLVDANGAPFALSELFHVLPGTLLNVQGYRDASAPCPGLTLDVIQATIQAIPGVSGADEDGNQMADSWELFFLAGSAQDAQGDPDGDLYSNLQEYLDGTSPVDALSRPSGPPASLGRPEIKIMPKPDGQLHLSWTWPAEYAENVQFRIRTTADLHIGFSEHEVIPVQTAPGYYEAWLTPAHPRQSFFQVYYTILK